VTLCFGDRVWSIERKRFEDAYRLDPSCSKMRQIFSEKLMKDFEIG
jgi:hypothetical protein